MDWNIDFAVLLGVAGTLKPNEAGLCDVVIADKIIDITYGAETDGGYTPQANMPEIDVRLVEWIHDFETQIFGKAFPNSDDLPKGKTTFKVAVGPIGNSGHVIKSEQVCPMADFLIGGEIMVSNEILREVPAALMTSSMKLLFPICP